MWVLSVLSKASLGSVNNARCYIALIFINASNNFIVENDRCCSFHWAETVRQEKWYRPLQNVGSLKSDLSTLVESFWWISYFYESRFRLALSAVVALCKWDVGGERRKYKCQCDGSGTALSAQRDGGRRLNRPERKKARLKAANIVSAIHAIPKYTWMRFPFVSLRFSRLFDRVERDLV